MRTGPGVQDECNWHGVAICRYRNGRRITAGLQLRKWIKDVRYDEKWEATLISYLRCLYAASNNAVGGVPEEICMLMDLESLLLENNQLGGSLPTCLTSLSSVFEFDVHSNDFSGSPPPGFFDMPKLQTLDLSSNQFSGGLNFLEGMNSRSTNSAQSTSPITTLRLNNNGFVGDVPRSVYDLNALKILTLYGTSVTGNVSALCSKPSVSVLSTDCSQVACDEACCQCV